MFTCLFQHLYLSTSNCFIVKRKCWKMFKNVEHYWKLLKDVENCWKVLKNVEKCWKVLKTVKKCWKLLKNVNQIFFSDSLRPDCQRRSGSDWTRQGLLPPPLPRAVGQRKDSSFLDLLQRFAMKLFNVKFGKARSFYIQKICD